MTSPEIVILLFVAGFFGGAANAMAGGATLITFPAMLAAGLPPITANASNALAVSFGNLTGAWRERQQLPPIDAKVQSTIAAAVVGGLLGAVLLVTTPDNVFKAVVPALIGIATLIFAFAKPIQNSLVRTMPTHQKTTLNVALVFVASVYGGYFGAGLGVILMAVISATNNWDMRRSNAVKNLLGVVTNVAAIVFFIYHNLISWPQTSIMLVACIAGGFAGVHLLKTMPAPTVRTMIIVIGSIMTLIYAYKFWL